MFSITTSSERGIAVLSCGGQITLHNGGSRDFRDAVIESLKEGNKKILVDLGEVDYLDSTAIGELVSAFTRTRGEGGELKLCALQKKPHDLLQITKLYTVFDVAIARNEGLQLFK